MKARELIAAVPGLTRNQIGMWTRAGYLRPRAAVVRGSSADYPKSEAAIAWRMLRLLRAGFRLEAAAAIARRLVDEPEIELIPGMIIRRKARTQEPAQ